MVGVRFEELSLDNWEAVADLVVAPGQENFVAPNIKTIAETQWYPWTHRRVIYAGQTVVGFAVYGRMSDDRDMWLHRFMIAADHQGKGYGRAALRELIAEWRTMPNVPLVKLSYEPNNKVAEDLYVSEGFVPGEIADWGERIAALNLLPTD
jgi:diamine N-acetyltransferase